VVQLGLIPGHTYRLQFMVHDGDQNKSGGDVGESCANGHIPATVPCVPAKATVASRGVRQQGEGTVERQVSVTADGQVIAQPEALPTEFALLQNFPNPFRQSTVIRYALPEASTVSLKVFNIFGQEVATLASGTMSPGYHSMEWKARDHSDRPVPAGMYFYRMDATGLKTGTFHQLRKMVLIK